MSGSTSTLGSFRCGRDSMAKKSSITPCGIVAVDQRRAERPERVRPGAHDRHAERHGGPLDREGHQQAQPVAVFVAVADDGEPHLAVFQPRHGRRQEARVEEDVGLDGAGAEIVEFLDEVEAGRGRIDGQLRGAAGCWPAVRPGRGSAWRPPNAGEARRSACRTGRRSFPREAGRRPSAAALRLVGAWSEDRASTMPSLRHTVKDSAAASNSMATAVAIAAPHRPKCGISSDAERRR